MPGYQQIRVVSTAATGDELERLAQRLGNDRTLVLTAPTSEAKAVVDALGVRPQPEVLLAPVRFPEADRGHRLDELVRRHALQDRFRDVVVVADPPSTVLLLRVMAPDQLASGGAVTVVGLPRADRTVSVGRVLMIGILIGFVTAVLSALPFLVLPGAVAFAGLVLLLTGPDRTVGRELLLGSGVALVVFLAIVAGSARFPAA